MEEKETKLDLKKNSPRSSHMSGKPNTYLLDFSFRSLFSAKDITDEISSGEISGIKRYDNGKIACTALRLNNNSIGDLHELSDTAESVFENPDNIEWVDLSFNDLTSIEGVSHTLLKAFPNILCFLFCVQICDSFKNLKVLYLHGNTLEHIEEIRWLQNFSQLRSLTLHGNPIESEKGYRQYVVSMLPTLKTLDFSGVTKQDRSTAETWNKMHGVKRMKRKKSTS